MNHAYARIAELEALLREAAQVVNETNYTKLKGWLNKAREALGR